MVRDEILLGFCGSTSASVASLPGCVMQYDTTIFSYLYGKREDELCQSYLMQSSNFLRVYVLVAHRPIRSSPMHSTYDTLSRPCLLIWARSLHQLFKLFWMATAITARQHKGVATLLSAPSTSGPFARN